MKSNYLLMTMIILLAFSCSKEESLVATQLTISERYVFPEGTPYDDLTESIFSEYGIRIIYKGLQPEYVNSSLKGSYKVYDIMSDELAEKSIRFVYENVLKKLKPELLKPVSKPYIYLTYDLRSPNGVGGYSPIKYEFAGLDNWIFCFEGRNEFYPAATPITFPEKEADVKVQRGIIIQNILRKMVAKNVIEIPELFYTDFDYVTPIKTATGTQNDPDFFMKRGFVGGIGTSSFSFSTSSYDIKKENSQDTFIKYLIFIAKFSKQDLENGEKLGPGVYKNFPKVMQYYDYVDQYMLEKYGYDLKQIQIL